MIEKIIQDSFYEKTYTSVSIEYKTEFEKKYGPSVLTRDGNLVPMRLMRESHLNNFINMLLREDYLVSKGRENGFAEKAITECQIRNFRLDAANELYEKFIKSERYYVDEYDPYPIDSDDLRQMGYR